MNSTLPRRPRFSFHGKEIRHLAGYPEDPCATPGGACAFRGNTAEARGRPTGAWSLELQTDRDTYALGRPVVLTLTLTRRGRGSAQTLTAPRLGDGYLSLTIAPEGGEPVAHRPLVVPCTHPRWRSVAHGRALHTIELLHIDAAGPLFPRGGRYRLHVVHRGFRAGRFLIAETSLEVEGPDLAGRGPILHDLTVGRVLQWLGGRHLHTDHEALREMARSGSELAPFARLTLALAPSSESGDRRRESSIPAERSGGQVQRDLEASLDAGLPGALELRAAGLLASILRNERSGGEARSLVHHMRARWRRTPALVASIRSLEGEIDD